MKNADSSVRHGVFFQHQSWWMAWGLNQPNLGIQFMIFLGKSHKKLAACDTSTYSEFSAKLLNPLDVPFVELGKKQLSRNDNKHGRSTNKYWGCFPEMEQLGRCLNHFWLTKREKRRILLIRSLTGQHGNTRTTSYHWLGDRVSTTPQAGGKPVVTDGLIVSTAPTSSATLCVRIQRHGNTLTFLAFSSHIRMPYVYVDSKWMRRVVVETLETHFICFWCP